jgi:hypothetical protein
MAQPRRRAVIAQLFWRRPVRRAAAVRCPILLIVAEHDTMAPTGPALRVAERAPRGDNYWIRPGVNTLEILAGLGFTYHIDDLSADEPFLQLINGQPFATVPYTVHLNDIASFDFPGFNPAAYEQQMLDEFDQLYAEGAARRRMMVIGLHERISGHASRVRVLDRIFTRLRERDDVWWARKDQIARWVLDHPDTAAWVDRDPAPVSGLPGRSS